MHGAVGYEQKSKDGRTSAQALVVQVSTEWPCGFLLDGHTVSESYSVKGPAFAVVEQTYGESRVALVAGAVG